MDGSKLYWLEALDFRLGKIAGLELRLRAMPKNLLLVRVPDSMSTQSMSDLRKTVEKLTGLEVMVLVDTIEFCRFVEVPDPATVAREIAEKHTILRAVVGSTAHGLNLPGQDDWDEMGILG